MVSMMALSQEMTRLSHLLRGMRRQRRATIQISQTPPAQNNLKVSYSVGMEWNTATTGYAENGLTTDY